MLVSIILNSLIVVINICCLVWGVRKADPPSRLFRYFTTLSNMLCAFASAAVIIMQATGGLQLWTVLFKYVGACAVAVTMLTVLLFLGPLSHDWRALLSGAELFLHLICPLLAVVSFLFFEKNYMPAWSIALGISPVILYALLYCRKVIYSPEPKRWEDFYGFNHSGKWPLSFGFMILGAGVVAFALWAI